MSAQNSKIDNEYVKYVATIKSTIPIIYEKDDLEVMIHMGNNVIQKPRTQPSHMGYWAGSGNVDYKLNKPTYQQ